MESKENKLLDHFSRELKDHIIEFCKDISSIDADVFILLARKAACFIDVLTEINLVHLKGDIVSERVLDMDTKWLRGQRVVIIDDTIISGTSIKKNIDKLNKIGVASVMVKVFCINDYWYVPELLENEKGISYLQEPYLKLEHTSSLKFCQNIVQLLSIFPRPYSTDFPIYDSLRIIESDFNKLLFSNEWKVVDTTSSFQIENNVSTISLNPKRKIVDEFYKSIGADLKDYTFIKIRLYAYRFNAIKRDVETKFGQKKSRAFYLCRALPLILFNPVSTEYIDEVIRSICVCENIEQEVIQEHFNENISKLRFVQYYFAQRFMNFFIDWMNNHFHSKVTINDPFKSLNFMFSPIFQEIIKKFSFNGILKNISSNQSDHFLVKRPDAKKEGKIINPLKIKDDLLNVFLNYYYDEELPARRLVKQKKLEAFKDFTCKSKINRLERGVSFLDLKNILIHDISNNTDLNLIISSFLDNAIDCGIVVPISVEDTEYLYRGYRHGEEVIWGKNNDKLLAYFYESILKNSKQTTLSKFWFEKLLVLFLKMGLKAGILQEYNFNSPPNLNLDLIGVRSYLYGQVSISYKIKPRSETHFNPILDYETKSNWYSKRLMDLDIIKEKNSRYEIDTDKLYFHKQLDEKLKDEPDDLSEDLLDTSEEIAELLAIAYNDKKLTEEGLVQLTSSSAIDDNISSIAAEIYIFNQNIQTTLDKIHSALENKNIDIDFLNKLRGNREHSWISINSGQKKYLDFKNGEGQKLIKEISDHLGSIDSFKKRSWKKYWKQTKNINSNEAPELYHLNDEIGKVIIEMNIIYTFSHMLIYKILEIDNQIKPFIEHIKSNILNLEEQSNLLKIKIESLIRESDSDEQIKIDFINAVIIEKLRKERNKLKLERLSEIKKIEYWNEYWDRNKEKVEFFHKQYLGLFTDNVEIDKIFIKTQRYKAEHLGDVFDELKKNNLLLQQYISTTEILLNEFSSLVPQWGKINKTIDYSTVIHINTTAENEEIRKKVASAVKKVLADFEYNEFKSNEKQEKTIVLFKPNIQKDNIGYYIGAKGQFKIDRAIKLASQLLTNINLLQEDYSISLFLSLSREHSVKVFYNPKTTVFDFVSYDFTQYFEDCEKIQLNLSNGLFIYDNSDMEIDYYYDKIKSSIGDYNIDSEELKFKDIDNSMKNLHKFSVSEEINTTKMTIGIVTALPKEFASMQLMLDEIEVLNDVPENDPNDYIVGYIKSKHHNKKTRVIITILKDLGNSNAATTTTNLLRTFPEIDQVLLVGIAGGVPNPQKPEDHVRLGDIVYSDSLLQYDNIKVEEDSIIIRSNTTKPSSIFIGKARKLESERLTGSFPWDEYIALCSKKIENGLRPDISTDVCTAFGKKINHPIDINRRLNYPRVFNGKIGSAHTLLKNETKRNYLRDTYSVKAIEMEGAGVADTTWSCSKDYFIVRGIVDYCDPIKSDEWQNHGAICAASYAKCLIELIF